MVSYVTPLQTQARALTTIALGFMHPLFCFLHTERTLWSGGLGPDHVRAKSPIDREDGLLLRDLPGRTSRRGVRPQGDRLSSKSLSGAIDSATREHGTAPDNTPELCTLLQILKGLLADLARKGWNATRFMEGSGG